MEDIFSEQSEAPTRTAYRLKNRIFEGRTAAGVDVLIADTETYGRMLFLDGELQSASADEHLYHEALVHPVMATCTDGDLMVLVIGGGEGATVREVERWPNVRHIDWVDYDAELVAICNKELGWRTKAVAATAFHGKDIREAFPELGTYDVIIVDLPDPDGEHPYIYTSQFWADLKSHLNPDGKVVSHCGPVHPWGSIGEGYQRLRGVDLEGGRFYHQNVPSFQGEWGFIMWSSQSGRGSAYEPTGARVATPDQLIRWSSLEGYWQTVIDAQPLKSTESEAPACSVQ